MQIDKDYLVRVRREMHKVPELGFELPKSLAILRKELDAIGIPYTEEYGRSCIIATLNEGVGNKTIAIRADFDALPIMEETGLSFASTHPGNMHACGHDAHAAMLLTTAKALKAMEKDIKCCVKFVFQSAEEILGGAKTICDDGFMDQVDEIIGCHINPVHPAGTILTNPNCDSACSRGFKIHLYGRSAHVASPQRGVDAIAMAVRVYSDIQFLRAREMNPIEPVIIGIGSIHGGTVNNIICDHVVMDVSVRTQHTELDAHIFERITHIAQSVAEDMGGRAEIEVHKYSPALRNDLTILSRLEESAKKVVGPENVRTKKDSMGAEDFAYYLQHKPGCMFSLGVMECQPPVPLHNGKMLLNEDSLEVGVKVFIQYILDQMEN